jgi:hypothetical protein
MKNKIIKIEKLTPQRKQQIKAMEYLKRIRPDKYRIRLMFNFCKVLEEKVNSIHGGLRWQRVCDY